VHSAQRPSIDTQPSGAWRLRANSSQGDPQRLAGWAFFQMASPPHATLTRTDGPFRSCPGSRVSRRHVAWVTKPSAAVAHA